MFVSEGFANGALGGPDAFAKLIGPNVTVAIQIGQGTTEAHIDALRSHGIRIEAWGDCADTPEFVLRAELSMIQPERFIAQVEGWMALRALQDRQAARVFGGLPLDCVTTLEPGTAWPCQRTYVECYASSGNQEIGRMLDGARQQGWPAPRVAVIEMRDQWGWSSYPEAAGNWPVALYRPEATSAEDLESFLALV